MATYIERALIVSGDLMDEDMSTWQVGDVVAAGDHAALSTAGLAGDILVIEQPQPSGLSDGSYRLRVAEQDSPPAVWAPKAVVAATLTLPIGVGALTTQTVSVSGVALSDVVMVGLASAPDSALLAVLDSGPFGWVSATDTVTIAARTLATLLSARTLDVVVYVLPPPA